MRSTQPIPSDPWPHDMVLSAATPTNARQRFGYVLGALPGVVLQFLLSVVAWTWVQLNSLMVAGCGAQRACNHTLTYLAANGIQPALIAVWVVTTVLGFALPLAWGRSPYPVLGIGVGVSILITAIAYLTLSIGAGIV